MARAPRSLALGCWLVLLAVANGCVTEPVVDPVVDIEQRKLVVLPFSDPLFARYESRRGNTLAKMVSDWIAEKRRQEEDDAIEVVRFDELVAALRDVDPRELDPLEIARRTGADYVLVGEITHFETRRRGDVGVIRGSAEVRFDVLDRAAGPDRPIFSGRVTVQYPPDDYTMAGVMPLTEGDEKAIETGLMLRLTERIGELFTYHKVGWQRR